MYLEKPVKRRFPKVPFDRRAYAFLIDFVTVWLISSITSNPFLQLLTFMGAWFGLRVILVQTNQGQSLGRWALDMKVINGRYNRMPGLVSLAKREGILGFAAYLSMIGLNLTFINAMSTLLLICPLLADGCFALANENYNEAFHDRLAETIVIQTRRGFSLDLRLKKIVAEVRRNMRK